jgi:hypothetical protein
MPRLVEDYEDYDAGWTLAMLEFALDPMPGEDCDCDDPHCDGAIVKRWRAYRRALGILTDQTGRA